MSIGSARFVAATAIRHRASKVTATRRRGL